MADPASYRPAPGSIPEQPGVYRFRDERGRVIYVGKARSLRPRLSSYFQDLANHDGQGLIFTRYSGHLSKLGMIRAEVMDGEYSTGIHG